MQGLNKKQFYQMQWVGRSHEQDFSIQLTYQERFPARHSRGLVEDRAGFGEVDFRSISYTKTPDFFIRIKQRGKTRALILDAKYRTMETALKQAFESLHIYRDALRMGSGGVACGVFMLTPGYDQRVAMYFEREYREAYGIGGFVLKPRQEQQAEELKRWLQGWMDSGWREEE